MSEVILSKKNFKILKFLVFKYIRYSVENVSNFVELGSSSVECVCAPNDVWWTSIIIMVVYHLDTLITRVSTWDRLDLDKFGKGRDDWQYCSGAQVGSVELRRVQNRAPVQIPSSWLSSAHCTPTAQRWTRSRYWMSPAGQHVMTGPNLALEAGEQKI